MEELPVTFITDQELQDREEDLEEIRERRQLARCSVTSQRGSVLDSGALSPRDILGLQKDAEDSSKSLGHVQFSEDAKLLEVKSEHFAPQGSARLSQRIAEKERRRSTMSGGPDGALPGSQLECGKVETEKTVHTGHGHGHGGGSHHAAVMVWLGILIDAVPESLVIGILMNKSAAEGQSSSGAALPFVMGVFLSNLPESMSSSGSMKAHGMRISTILMMWMTIVVLTAIGAMLGAIIFPPSSIKDPDTKKVVAGVEGLAAGAMLTMIAQTMMPEAFEQGGDVVGLSCLAGFLVALMVKLIPTGDDNDASH